MIQPPFVSVIVPCRNEGLYINKCLYSLVHNDYPSSRFEIIVVDGMSDDDTWGIINYFCECYPNVKKVKNPNKTTPFAFNLGIKEALGDYILRADAHAEYPANYIQYLTNIMQSDYTVDNAGGRLCIQAESSKLKAERKGIMEKGLTAIRHMPFGPQNDSHVPDLIMIAGSHCEYPSDYIRKLSERSVNAENVGPCIEAVNENGRLVFKAIDTVRSDVFGIGKSAYRQLKAQSSKLKAQREEGIEVDTVFGGCYRREVFEKIGLFNEKLTRGQDLEFNLRLKRAGMKTKLYPEIVVKYFPKNELWPFLKHSFDDGYWITAAMAYADNPVTLRHLVPLFFVLLLPLAVIPYIPVNLIRSIQLAMKLKDARMLFVLPWLFFLFHVFYGIGSVVGLLKTAILKIKGGRDGEKKA